MLVIAAAVLVLMVAQKTHSPAFLCAQGHARNPVTAVHAPACMSLCTLFCVQLRVSDAWTPARSLCEAMRMGKERGCMAACARACQEGWLGWNNRSTCQTLTESTTPPSTQMK